MHPTMELLLRHAIQYFGMKGKPILVEPRNLDSVPRFLSDMAKLSPDEQLVVMCVHLLTMMLDGEMDEPVRRSLAFRSCPRHSSLLFIWLYPQELLCILAYSCELMGLRTNACSSNPGADSMATSWNSCRSWPMHGRRGVKRRRVCVPK